MGGVLTLLLAGVAAISLLVGGIGIMNIMLGASGSYAWLRPIEALRFE